MKRGLVRVALRPALCTVLGMSLGVALSLAPGCAGRDGGEPQKRQPNTLTAAERDAGWELLFDGESLRGWQAHRGGPIPEGWQAVEGTLHHTQGGGDIVTAEVYEDFELKLEWKIQPAGNSGIFFHVSDAHDWVWQTGPEMQVLDNDGHPDGGEPRTSAGSNYALHAPERDATWAVGQFNEAHLTVTDGHVEHRLNGLLLLEYDLGSPEWEALVAASKFASMPDYGRAGKGRIALQDHGDRVWYRNLRIRRL